MRAAHWTKARPGTIDLQETREDTRFTTLTFSLGGTADFCAALREQFALD
jgi:hypothetical protein